MPYRKAWEVSYQRERYEGGPGRYVDAGPVRARIAELSEVHVPLRALARGSGLSDTGIRAILDGRRQYVQRATARRVASLSLAGVYGGQATGHVPRIGAVRRVQALMALGWTHDAIAAAGAANTSRLVNGGGALMTVERWRDVRDVYDRLSMIPGPSPETRGWARSLGYPPPLAWDEETIDDPTGVPYVPGENGGADVFDLVAVRRAATTGDPTPAQLSPPERAAVVRSMATSGASDTEIAGRLGVACRTVLRARQDQRIPAGQPQFRPGARASEWAEAHAATRPCRPDGPSPDPAPPAYARRPA